MGGKKKYISVFGSFMEPFNCNDLCMVWMCCTYQHIATEADRCSFIVSFHISQM